MSSLPGELPTKIDFNLVQNLVDFNSNIQKKLYCRLATELQNRKTEIDKIGCEIASNRFSLVPKNGKTENNRKNKIVSFRI